MIVDYSFFAKERQRKAAQSGAENITDDCGGFAARKDRAHWRVVSEK